MIMLKLSKPVVILLILACAFLSSYFILIGSGMFTKPSSGRVLVTCLLILLLSSSKKAFYFFLLPIAIIYAIYTPAGLNLWPPSYQYIASVFATDLLETKEFLQQIPMSSYLIAIAIPVLLVLQYKISKAYDIQFYRKKGFIIVAGMLFAYYLPVANPIKELCKSSVKITKEMADLKALSKSNNWGSSALVHSKYDDYVMILGESARRDYHHAYGYPVENTPFMLSLNGTLIDGMTSAGTNTIASLRLMLTLPDKEKWKPHYDLSLMDLVKSARVKTYWISNQGFLGEYDTPISSIASKSDKTIFLKNGDSFNSTNYSDFDLLPKFTQVLEDPIQGKRFIVLHLYGSHPMACDRVEDYPKILGEIKPQYDYLNCYVSSIRKTDEFLKRTYEQLKANEQKTGRSFSMFYFSDHGLCHQENEKDGTLLFNQNCHSQLHHNIPLFKVSSDDTERHQYKVFKSGLNFLEGVAHWIGIENPKLDSEADLFSNQADKSDYGLQDKIKKKYRKDVDPAVDIRPKK